MSIKGFVTRGISYASLFIVGVMLAAAPVAAAQLSGGASGGGAIQGGDGAPGSGTGIPGAIINNTTASGIGEDATYAPSHRTGRVAGQPVKGQFVAFYRSRHHI